MKTDNEVIKSCLQGNQKAFKELYERYGGYCFGICKRYGVSESDMKDQIQITFIQVFQSLHNYQSHKSSFKTWFSRICVNHILMKRRKHKEQLFLEDLTVAEGKIYFPVASPEFLELDKECLLKLLQHMPEKFRLVFNMFIIDEYTHREIAAHLNISVASSRVILNRARKWAQDALEETLKLH